MTTPEEAVRGARCVACGRPATEHNSYNPPRLNDYAKFSVCDSCLPTDEPLEHDMEPEEAALRVWRYYMAERDIPPSEVCERLMGWTDRALTAERARLAARVSEMILDNPCSRADYARNDSFRAVLSLLREGA